MLDGAIPLIVTFVLAIVASVAGVKYKRGKDKVTKLLLDVIAAVQDDMCLKRNAKRLRLRLRLLWKAKFWLDTAHTRGCAVYHNYFYPKTGMVYKHKVIHLDCLEAAKAIGTLIIIFLYLFQGSLETLYAFV